MPYTPSPNISVVGTAQSGMASVSPISVTLPSTPASGDLIAIYITGPASAGLSSAGYTVTAGATVTHNHYLVWKIAAGSDANPSISFTAAGDYAWVSACYRSAEGSFSGTPTFFASNHSNASNKTPLHLAWSGRNVEDINIATAGQTSDVRKFAIHLAMSTQQVASATHYHCDDVEYYTSVISASQKVTASAGSRGIDFAGYASAFTDWDAPSADAYHYAHDGSHTLLGASTANCVKTAWLWDANQGLNSVDMVGQSDTSTWYVI